jgi:hypothetical protein
MYYKNNEIPLKLEKGINVSYKRISKTGTIGIIVKGKFKPNKEKSNYNKESYVLKTNFLNNMDSYLKNLELIQNHYILKPEFTEKGISFHKNHKFKYSMFINLKKRTSNIEDTENILKTIITQSNVILKNCLDLVNYEIVF